MLPAAHIGNAANETPGTARPERPTKFKADQIFLLRRATRCRTGKRHSNSAEGAGENELDYADLKRAMSSARSGLVRVSAAPDRIKMRTGWFFEVFDIVESSV